MTESQKKRLDEIKGKYNSDFREDYGVKGMKWGHHKSEEPDSGKSKTKSAQKSDYSHDLVKNPDFIGISAVEEKIKNELMYRLPTNATSCYPEHVRILTPPEDIESGGGLAEVEAEIKTNYRIPYSYYDHDLGRNVTEYDYESEYETRKFDIQVLDD